jgi:uncharacterized membrane protein
VLDSIWNGLFPWLVWIVIPVFVIGGLALLYDDRQRSKPPPSPQSRRPCPGAVWR